MPHLPSYSRVPLLMFMSWLMEYDRKTRSECNHETCHRVWGVAWGSRHFVALWWTTGNYRPTYCFACFAVTLLSSSTARFTPFSAVRSELATRFVGASCVSSYTKGHLVGKVQYGSRKAPRIKQTQDGTDFPAQFISCCCFVVSMQYQYSVSTR